MEAGFLQSQSGDNWPWSCVWGMPHSIYNLCSTQGKPQAFVGCTPTPRNMHLYVHTPLNVICTLLDKTICNSAKHRCLFTHIHAQQTASSVWPQLTDCLNHIECACVAKAKVRSDKKTAALPSMWTVLSSSYRRRNHLRHHHHHRIIIIMVRCTIHTTDKSSSTLHVDAGFSLKMFLTTILAQPIAHG